MPRKKKPNPDDEVILSFRVKRHMRDAFTSACDSVDTTSSRELRAHIRKFIAKHGQEKLL